ncbi:MAG: PAS domain S-box protein [Nibricoccus sp.]
MDPQPHAKPQGTPEKAGKATAVASPEAPLPAATFNAGRLVAKVVLSYVLLSATWILVSDRAVEALIPDGHFRILISMVKGWAFVVVTAAFLFFLLRRETRRWNTERNARIEAELSQRKLAQRQHILLEASRIAWESSGSEEDLSKQLMAVIGPFVEATVCFHYRFHPEEHELELISAVGVEEAMLPRLRRISADYGFISEVISTAKPVVVGLDRLRADPRPSFVREMIKSFVAMPLLSRDRKVLGTLTFASGIRENFQPEEVAMLQIVSRVASLATERMRSMVALQESESRFRQMADSLPQLIWTATPAGECNYLSRQWSEFSGMPVENQLGRGWEKYVHPDDLDRLRKTWNDALQSGRPVQAQQRIRARDGSYHWFDTRAAPQRGSDGAISLWLGANTDITEQKLAELALREIEEKQRLFIEHAPVALAMFDREMRYLAASRRWMSDFRMEKKSVMGICHYDVFPNLPPAFVEAHRRGLNGEIISSESDEYIRPDGTKMYVRWQVHPWRNSEGDVGGILVFTEDITSRVAGEQALRESEERFRAVVESAADGIFVQTEGSFAYLNPAAVRLFGAKSADELLGQPVLRYFHPEDHERIRERIRQLKEDREPVPQIEERLLHADGSCIYVEVAAVPFVYRGQRGALVFARDITERRQNEARLRFQQDILEETGRIAKVGGWYFDPRTGAGSWTDEVARIHDLSTDVPPSVGSGLDFYTPESRRVIEHAVKEAVESGRPYDLELEMISAKGVRKWVRTIGHPVVQDGKVIQVRGSFQDITERKLSEEALRESEARFRQVVENIEEVFWVTTPDKAVVLYISPAYEKVWGRSTASLIESPRSWLDAIHDEDRERVRNAAVKQAEGTYIETYRIVRPDKTIRWIEDRAFPVRNASGIVYRIVGTATDVTEHRKLEAQYRQAQKMEAIGTLAGGIAHDFNNILGAISGFAELAKIDPSQETISTSLDEILKACRRASDLVRQILAFSRQHEQKRLPIQLWRVIDEAVRLLRAALPATIQFDVQLTKEVPSVLADSTQIHQIVMNLCTNAAQAMAGKAGTLTVKLEQFDASEEFVEAHPGSRVGRYVRLEVRDTGLGMSQATVERIFEPFFTTKAPGQGSGLGLAVVHGIVQNHDGLITVYSRLGEGTAFHVYFPAYEKSGDETEIAKPDIARGKGETVLVLDDELSLAQMTGKMLQALGYRPTVETQPAKALAALQGPQRARYDLILADLTMPQMTGLEFAAAVLKDYPETRLIVMTGYITRESQNASSALNIREILMKPLTLQSLADAVQRGLSN